MRGVKSVGQMLWEMAQFYPQTRDNCVARAMKQKMAGRQKLETCNWEVERRMNSYNHLHLHMMSSDVSFPFCLAVTELWLPSD